MARRLLWIGWVELVVGCLLGIRLVLATDSLNDLNFAEALSIGVLLAVGSTTAYVGQHLKHRLRRRPY